MDILKQIRKKEKEIRILKNKLNIIKRRYIYEKTYQEIITWAKINKIKAPNNKDNFPFYLEKYIEELKHGRR